MQQPENNPQPNALPPKITKEVILQSQTDKKAQVAYWLKTVLYLLASSFLISFAAYSLITPNKFTIGGASGISILVNVASGGAIPQSVMLFAINAPLVVLAFFLIKKKFAFLSIANIVLQTLWLTLLELALPDFKIVFENSGEKIFAAIASGLCVGVATALALKIGGSTGGGDILAVLIQKKFSANSIATMLMIINCIIIGSSIFVFQGDTLAQTLLPIMMSIFEVYIETKANETVTSGFTSAIEFKIITNKPEELSLALMNELGRGVTSVPATGMYTKIACSMIICVVSRRQAATLQRIVKKIDPDSFAVMSNVSQVLGLGFYTSEL